MFSLRKGLAGYTEGPGFSMPPYEHGKVFRTVTTHPEPDVVHGHLSWIGGHEERTPREPERKPGANRERKAKRRRGSQDGTTDGDGGGTK